jgi:hypothetical protein
MCHLAVLSFTLSPLAVIRLRRHPLRVIDFTKLQINDNEANDSATQ